LFIEKDDCNKVVKTKTDIVIMIINMGYNKDDIENPLLLKIFLFLFILNTPTIIYIITQVMKKS